MENWMNTLISDPLMVGIIAGIAAFLGGAGIWSVLVKWMNRDVDHADAKQRRALAARDEVTTLREILDEYREERGFSKAKIETLETRMSEREERISRLESRMTEQEVKLVERDRKIATLEDRERHALIRAGVHEAWDQMSFALLAERHPDHPPPPPIRDPIPLGDGSAEPEVETEVSLTRRTRTTSSTTTTTDDGTGP